MYGVRLIVSGSTLCFDQARFYIIVVFNIVLSWFCQWFTLLWSQACFINIVNVKILELNITFFLTQTCTFCIVYILQISFLTIFFLNTSLLDVVNICSFWVTRTSFSITVCKFNAREIVFVRIQIVHTYCYFSVR